VRRMPTYVRRPRSSPNQVTENPSHDSAVECGGARRHRARG
jgi:hypothetical protein